MYYNFTANPGGSVSKSYWHPYK